MVTKYMPGDRELQPHRLGAAEFRSIGRLVRACAEIEDCLTHYLCHVAEINEGQALVLLGKLSVSGKKRIAQTFAEARGATELAHFKDLFGTQDYAEVFKCRNAVAHGVLLGRTIDGHIAFRATDLIDADTVKATVSVTAYTTEGIYSYAETARAIADKAVAALNHGDTQEKRRARGLRRHPKGQPKGQGAQ